MGNENNRLISSWRKAAVGVYLILLVGIAAGSGQIRTAAMLAASAWIAGALALPFRLGAETVSIEAIGSALRRSGMRAVVVGDEIRVESAGKLNIIRLCADNMVQVARVYAIDQKPVLDANEAAAAVTSGEVDYVKVGVVRAGDSAGSLVFSAESIYPGRREVSRMVELYVGALDYAELRQGENVRNATGRKAYGRRRIGFRTSSDTDGE